MHCAHIKKNDIWRCKNTYKDSLGMILKSEVDSIVVVVMGPERLNDDDFIRVQPISFQVNHRTSEDIFIDDLSVLGNPFIIETWNEQPILTSLLDEKLGEINTEKSSSTLKEPDIYSTEQVEFRKSEIKKTAFLRQSVLSAFAKYDQKTNDRSKVIKLTKFLSYAAVVSGIALIIWQPQKLQPDAYFEKYKIANNYQLNMTYGEALRGSNVIIEPFNPFESEIIETAIARYKSGDYKAANSLFSKVPNLARNESVFLYSAISQIFVSDYSSGIEKLELLKKKNNPDLIKDVLYYLVISYAANGKESLARETLKELEKMDPELHRRDPDMLKDLRWF